MIPSLIKRLSARLSFTRTSSNDEDTNEPTSSVQVDETWTSKDNNAARSLLKRKSSSDKVPLSKRATLILDEEDGEDKQSSKKILSKKSSTYSTRSTRSHSLTTSKSSKKQPKTHSTKQEATKNKGSISPKRNVSHKKTSSTKTTSLPSFGKRNTSKSKETRVKAGNLSKSISTKRKQIKTLWYLRGTYVTVRTEDGGWYLCRLQHNVYNTTKCARIRWLTETDRDGGSEFRLDYRDEVDPAAILMNVEVEVEGSRYRLREEDRLETQRLLKVVEDVAIGNMDVDDVDSDVERVLQIEPPSKKRRMIKDTREKVEGKEGGGTPSKSRQQKQKVEPKRKSKEGKESRAMSKTSRQKEEKLHPKPHITVQKLDPFFETHEKVPFISKYAHSRLVFRAVQLKDYKLLKQLIKDNTGKIRRLITWRSVSNKVNALHIAITHGDMTAVKLLAKDFYGKEDFSFQGKRIKDAPLDKINLKNLGTGTSSPGSYIYNYGVESVGPVLASRGNREGNNAFTKDLKDMEEKSGHELKGYIQRMLQSGLDFDVMMEILATKDLLRCSHYVARPDQIQENFDPWKDTSIVSYICDLIFVNIEHALVRGHHDLAGRLLQFVAEKSARCKKRMSELHVKALLPFDEAKNLSASQLSHVIKPAYRMTPMHCAACNPDPRVLERLIQLGGDVHVPDRLNRRPVHFAATCVGTEPLKLLLQRGCKSYDCDRRGNLPLHFAVRANRVHNIRVLLDLDEDVSESDNPWLLKYGSVGINRPNKRSYTPLHIAVDGGNVESVQLLVHHGADVNATLNAAENKLTPLMLAAQRGFFNIAVFLVKNKASVDQPDRLGRTAVIHAAMNGNTNVLSYLLNLGASPTRCDSSGNSPLHYAAAYGWYFCVKTLLEAGANPNVANDWKIAPMSIAYMKGHTGMVTSMLEESDGDINFVDESGTSLLSLAVSSTLCSDLYEQVRYLVEDKGADCNIKDKEGLTALDFLVVNDVYIGGNENSKFPVLCVEAVETSVRIAKLLVEHGSDLNVVDKDGDTPVMTAMNVANLELVKYLVECGSQVLTEPEPKFGNTALNTICYDHIANKKDYLAILKYAACTDGSSGVQNLRQTFLDMIEVKAKDGATPLVTACVDYVVCDHQCTGEDTEEDKAAVRAIWQRGRDFIRCLIEEFGADVNKPFHQEDGENWHLCTSVAFMVDVNNCEYGGQREKDEPQYPGLKMILEFNPDVNTRRHNRHTPLTAAIWKNSYIALEYLMTTGKVDVNIPFINKELGHNEPLLTFALRTMGKEKVVCATKMLLEAGVDVNAKYEEEDLAPIHCGISELQSLEDTVWITEMLLDYGADVNSVGKMGRTALHMEVDLTMGNMDDNFNNLILLLDNGADLLATDDRGRIPLHYVLLLLDHIPSKIDTIDLYQMLASRMKAEDLNIQDKFGITALHRAAFRGAYTSCMYLIERGADINVKDNDGNTPLSNAVRGKNDGCATFLIQEGARVDITVLEKGETDSEKDNEKIEQPKWSITINHNQPILAGEKKAVTLLEYALIKDLQGVVFTLMEKPLKESGIRMVDAIEILLRQHKFNAVSRLLTSWPNTKEFSERHKHGRNMLHVMGLTGLAFDSAAEKVAKELLEKGVCPYQEDDYKCTPLLYAALNKNWKLCKFFLSLDVREKYKASKKDSFGRNLVAATFWGRAKLPSDFIEWLKELTSRGYALHDTLTDCPVDGDLPWNTVVDSEWKPDYWLKYNCAKVTPLIAAVHFNGQKVVQWMLKNSFEVNATDSDGRTPLMHAARLNDLHIVKTLMNFDHDPEAVINDLPEVNEEQKNKSKVQERVFKLKPRRSVSVLVGSCRNSETDEGDDNNEEMGKDMETVENTEESKFSKSEPVFKPYKKVSDVDLNAVDKNGWTVIHHAVCHLSFGTFDNDEMVFILAKAGAKLTVKNKQGDTPLDLAVKNGAFRIARMIQELENVPTKNRKEALNTATKVTDNIEWDEAIPSFYEDAESQIEKLGNEAKDTTKKDEEERVDPLNLKDGALVKDEEQDVLYDVLLTKVDVDARVWRMFTFYIMQLIYQPGRDLYVLFTRWGRVGETGQYQHTPFHKKEEAVKEFSKIFLSKSGNEWKDAKRFENKRKRYHLVKRNNTTSAKIDENVEFESKSSKSSKLPQSIQTTIKEMINVKSLKLATNLEPVDSGLMPFGSISREELQTAMELLKKISVLVCEVETYRMKNSRKRAMDIEAGEKENYQKTCEQISDLSCEYFQILPRKNSGLGNRRPLDEQREVTKEMRQVTNLLDYEVASRMLLAAKFREKDMNHLDYVYRSVGCQIQVLEEQDPESQYILTYVESSVPRVKVEGIYRLERDGEQERMDRKKLDNRRLLFHGSGVCNFISILHRGLVITPLDASYTGSVYGQGIYFSDSFKESLNYCSRYDPGINKHFMLVCEVALGTTKVVVNPERHLHERKATDEPFDSVLAVGRECPDEKHDVTMPNGAILPLGDQKEADLKHIKEHVWSLYNKYVVYDEAQVCLRYLIQFRD